MTFFLLSIVWVISAGSIPFVDFDQIKRKMLILSKITT